MSFDYINEAFKQLELLNEEAFDTSLNGINQLSDFLDNDEETVDVIDTDAETEDELQDSYLGKVIINCNVCHSHVFENKDEIVIDDEGIVNIDKQCPYCGEMSGFKMIGEVTQYQEEPEKTDPKVTVDGEEVDTTTEDDPKGSTNVEESTTKDEPAEEPINENLDLEEKNHKPYTRRILKMLDEEDEESLEEGIFGKKKNTATPGKSGKYEAAYKQAMEKTPVVVKMWRDKSHDPEIVDYFDSNLAAEGVVRRHEKDVDKSVVYRYMTAAAAEKAGAHVSLPSRFVNKYVKEDLDEATSVLDRMPDITKVKGSIADVLISHSAEIDACGANEAAVKKVITSILSSGECSDQDAAREAIDIINSCSGPRLWSTIGTYMSGIKVIDTSRRARQRLFASLEEGVNNVNVETDDSVVNVQSDEGGKITVSTEPKEPELTDEEAVGELSDETLADIETANTEEPTEEEIPVEDETVEEEPSEEETEVDMEEVDEESFDELGESYLRNVYTNVDSFKTSNVSSTDSHLIIEGIIKFKSGVEKKTGFIFEANSVTPEGKVKFTGKNEHFSRGSKSFTLIGRVDNKRLISESLNYNYRAKTPDGKSNKIYGTVTTK